VNLPAELVLGAVVAVRFVVPLTIFRWPLPGVLACLVVDAADQTLFQLAGVVPGDYEAYDKAMDTFYLAVAFLAVLRNWTAPAAVATARVLFLVRLAGATAYELLAWPPLLLLAPNTFEYFFISYEVVRSRWRTGDVAPRTWVAVAAALWGFVKIPPEWWLHVAHLDVTEECSRHPVPALLLLAVLAAAAVAATVLLRPRVPPPTHPLQLAAPTLPAAVDEADEQAEWRARHGRLVSWRTAEKLVVTALVVLVYGQVLPGAHVSEVELLVGSTLVVLGNAVVTLATARRHWTFRSGIVVAAVRLVINLVLVAALDAAATPAGDAVRPLPAAFLLLLVTVVTTAYDRYAPVWAYRSARRAVEQPVSPLGHRAGAR
jgi:hypothetical protein